MTHRFERCVRQYPSRGRELEGELDDAEEVDVGIVDRKVDGDETSAPLNPEPLLQLFDDGAALVFQGVKVLGGKIAFSYGFVLRMV